MDLQQFQPLPSQKLVQFSATNDETHECLFNDSRRDECLRVLAVNYPLRQVKTRSSDDSQCHRRIPLPTPIWINDWNQHRCIATSHDGTATNLLIDELRAESNQNHQQACSLRPDFSSALHSTGLYDPDLRDYDEPYEFDLATQVVTRYPENKD